MSTSSLSDLLSSFSPSLLLPSTSTTILLISTILRQTRSSSSIVERTIILLNDRILITKYGKYYECKQMVELRFVTVDVSGLYVNSSSGKKETEIVYYFKLITNNEEFIVGYNEINKTKDLIYKIADAIYKLYIVESNPIINNFGWKNNIVTGTIFFASLTNDNNLLINILENNKNVIDDVDDNQLTASHIAAYQGFADILIILFKYKPNLKYSSPLIHCSRLPIHLAAYNGHHECLTVLLEYEPDLLNLQDSDGMTAMDLCIFHITPGSADCVVALINEGADPNAKVGKCNLLHLAVDSGNIEAAKALLNSGAEVDILDDMQQSPLHYAVRVGNVAFVQLFIDHGAQVNRASVMILPAPPSSNGNQVQKQITRVTDLASIEMLSLLVRNGAFVPTTESSTTDAVSSVLNLFGSTKKEEVLTSSNFATLSPANISFLNVMYQDYLRHEDVLGDEVFNKAENMSWPQMDERMPSCSICCIDFSMIVRRHHCRRCLALVCGYCSLVKVISVNSNTKQRVCTGCYNILYHSRDERLPKEDEDDELPLMKVLEPGDLSNKNYNPKQSNPPDSPKSSHDTDHNDKEFADRISALKKIEPKKVEDRATSSATSLVTIQAALNLQMVANNIEKAKIVEEKTNEMNNQALSFQQMAKILKEREKSKSWYEF